MEAELTPRNLFFAHLIITVPAVAAFVLVVRLGLCMFGPFLFLYYVFGGVAAGWQWCSLAVQHWETRLARKGVQQDEIKRFARRAGLEWPGESAIGLFALHTTAVAVCGIHVSPWLVGRWFAWVLPLTGFSSTAFAADYYLQHLELLTVVPAFALGYFMWLRFPRLATWAWTLPTIILAYKLAFFADPSASVFSSNPTARFSYFFVIQRGMPTLSNFRGSDPVRVATQMMFVAPFYAGVAYSIGALAAKHGVLRKQSPPGVGSVSGQVVVDEASAIVHEHD
jgi:hypothetical protein